MTALSLASLRLDGGTQPRATERADWVQEYATEMLSGAAFPPVVVFFDGSAHWLADGFHRTRAARTAGRTEIEADIRQGTQRDAILFSVSANGTHGQRRTNEDKRRAVLRLLNDAEWAAWSDREIARRCGVDRETVGRLRPAPLTVVSASEQSSRTFTTKHGTTATMNTAAIGRRPAPPPIPEPVQANAAAAASAYIANQREFGQPATDAGFRDAVREAVHATLGPPPQRKPSPPPDASVATVRPLGNDWMDWTIAVQRIATSDTDLLELAGRWPVMHATVLAEARAALPKLTAWITNLEKINEARSECAREGPQLDTRGAHDMRRSG